MGWQLRTPDMVVRADDRDHGDILDNFYQGYERAFILPNERESLRGLRRCLSLNGHSFAFSAWPSREVVLVANDPVDGERIAGANFLATLIDGRIAIALNYVYVEPEMRGRGLLRSVLDAVHSAARFYLAAPKAAASMFIEQNDPMKMTAAQYSVDNLHSGVDQIDRLAIWARLGAQLVDLDYVQPPLSCEQDADGALVYAELRHGASQLSGAFLAAHLTSFFGISVLKGLDPNSNFEAARQISDARKRRIVKLFPMEPSIALLRANANRHSASRLIDLARSIAS